MDVALTTEQKSTYDKCKYVVRSWETDFKKTYGRLPSKLDIKEASRDVRNAYRIYFRLKTAALEQSLTNIDGFDIEVEKSEPVVKEPIDNSEKTELHEPTEISNKINTKDTWGVHLSNQHKNETSKKVENVSVNLSFTNKLFQGSKTSKRLPRKSLSFNRKKSDVDINKSQFFSQPDNFGTSTNEYEERSTSAAENSFNVKISAAPTALTQPINILQNIFSADQQDKPLRNIDKGWIERLHSTATPQVNNWRYGGNNAARSSAAVTNYDSDNVIDNSDDDCENSSSLYHLAKKRKLSSTGGSENNDQLDASLNSLVSVDASTKRLDFSNIFNSNQTRTKSILINNNKKIDSTYELVEASIKTNCELQNKHSDGLQALTCQTNDEKDKSLEDKPNDEDYKPEAKSKGVNIKNKIRARQKTTKQKSTKCETPTDVESTSQKSYELEYSVKPRIVTVPRITNIKQVISKTKKATPTTEDEQPAPTSVVPISQKESKLQKKIESGTLNDNYVQINLKKKIYVRGRKATSFSTYKKQMWKSKKKALCGPDMDMGGCDGGMLTCFNCGKTGHFARNCQNSKGDDLRPLAEDSEECLYPTLEEAAQMAEESALTIRKPNTDHSTKNSKPVENGTETNSENLFDDDNDLELLGEVERLEVEIAKMDVQRYIDSTTYVKPYYNSAGTIDTPQEVFETLELFGHKSFRFGQEEAIMRILSGKSTLLTLSTGSGKSLCYQLPAYLYSKREPCISLIISPLVSLMEDQVTGIPMFLKAACLHTNQSKNQKEKVMEAIKTGSLNILLVSPEAVVAGEKSSGFGSLLRQLPPIAFACIDEVHCVSHWSHNFRPSYLKICRVLKERLGVRTILGLTATATSATCDSIIEYLGIPDGRDGHISDIPIPRNLRLTVSKDQQRDQALMTLLLSEPYVNCRSIIVYCTRREECQRVAGFLRTCLKNDIRFNVNTKKRKRQNIQAECYHAGMSASRRKSIQKWFMSGELRIVVATVAFGMGINKSDIRSVIHYNMPMSFESYVQEVGRAGRDGLPAYCHLFLDAQGKDENELRRHVYANSTDRRVIRKLIQHCFIPCSCKAICPRHEVAFSVEETVQSLDIPEENIETLLCYLELHEKRYVELLSHAYLTCKIISYGSHSEITKASKHCAPLAMALALYKSNGKGDDNIFEFPVIEVASAIGWDSGICKHVLKNLEWININNQPKRSNLTVQFSNLGFRLLSIGNLSATELDATLDYLHNRVREQEHMSLLQLHTLHSTLTSVTCRTVDESLSNIENNEKELILKTKIKEYFESLKPLDMQSEIIPLPVNEKEIIADVRTLVSMYRDNSFTGRAVARIFHGIQSPNYPAVIWGRCKFWRAHINTDFNAICQIASKEI